MSYLPKGMHAAASKAESCVAKRLPTVRTILRRGRRQRVRLLDAWDLAGPTKTVAMPGPQESPTMPTMPRISRKLRVSPLTRIAEKLKRGWHK